MPRYSVPVRDASGAVVGIACGHRLEQRCQTCGRKASLLCDYPVRPRQEPPPKVGDARVHNVHKVVFWVHAVQGQRLCISTSNPELEVRMGPPRGQWVTEQEWRERSHATCGRPVCRSCAVRVGGLDYCAPHGRLAAAED